MKIESWRIDALVRSEKKFIKEGLHTITFDRVRKRDLKLRVISSINTRVRFEVGNELTPEWITRVEMDLISGANEIDIHNKPWNQMSEWYDYVKIYTKEPFEVEVKIYDRTKSNI